MQMQSLSKAQCIALIERESSFQAIIEDAFVIKIEEYSFFICTAIHAGHQFRDELKQQCLLNEDERLYEEDPYTDELITSMPITLIGCDSRYEYDLNRSPESCIYETAWGKTIWQTPLSDQQKQASMHKHQCFYDVFKALAEKIQQKHGSCLVYDVHSYNHLRITDQTPPVFNVGTFNLDKQRWKTVINHWLKRLNLCDLPNVDVLAKADLVFQGKGYLAEFTKQHLSNTLTLPTEVKKVFMDENSGSIFPLVMSELKSCFKEALLNNALYFSKRHTNKTIRSKTNLLSSNIEPSVLEVDRKLYKLCKGFETLFYINPKNFQRERKHFYAKQFNYQPEFTYNQLDINPFEFREQLYRLPVDNISDATIQQLYRDVIDSYATKIDLIASVGTENFLYNSLRYYGEPNQNENDAAKFLLYAKEFEEVERPDYQAETVKQAFQKAIDEYGIQCKVEITDKIIAAAMVNNAKKAILINKSIKINEIDLNALIHHELGVHMLTTINSTLQPLKIFRLGLPGNTCTQEGLAILSEYQSGNMQLTRLKTLALRVIAVHLMIKQYNFSHTFKTLMNDYGLEQNEAFQITARVYRGGGFTKDFLYLRGLKDALKLHQETDISALFVGKTDFKYLAAINELTARNIAKTPSYLPTFMTGKQPSRKQSPILDYLVNNVY